MSAAILALGNKWCKDNYLTSLYLVHQILALGISGARTTVILALGNKWCKDN